MQTECLPNTGQTLPDIVTFAALAGTTSALSTSSAAGFPVKTFPTPAEGQDLTENEAACFSRPFAWFANYDPEWLCWKTWQLCLLGDWTEFSGRWPRSGMMRNGIAYRLPSVGAPHIRDRVFVIGTLSDTVWTVSESGTGGRGIRQGNPPLADATELHGDDCDVHSERNPKGTRTIPKPGICSRPNRPDSWWATEPNVGRVANGVPARVDRLRGLGNAVVPQVAEFIGRQIVESMQ
jgi:hypothetical protein